MFAPNYKELVSAHGYAHNNVVIWKYPTLTKVVELNSKWLICFDLIVYFVNLHFFGHARLNCCLCFRSWRQSFQCCSESRFFHYGYTFWRRNHLSVEEFWIGSCSEEGQREDGEINEQYHSSVNSINDFLSHSLCWFHTYVTMFYSEIKTPFYVLAIDGHWLNQLWSLFLLDFKVLHMCKCK